MWRFHGVQFYLYVRKFSRSSCKVVKELSFYINLSLCDRECRWFFPWIQVRSVLLRTCTCCPSPGRPAGWNPPIPVVPRGSRDISSKSRRRRDGGKRRGKEALSAETESVRFALYGFLVSTLAPFSLYLFRITALVCEVVAVSLPVEYNVQVCQAHVALVFGTPRVGGVLLVADAHLAGDDKVGQEDIAGEKICCQ